MRQQSARIVSFLLSFVAGYVDSCSVLALFGLFVAQVTGSFVLASTQIVMLKPSVFLRFAEIFAFFLAGVATTVLVRSAEGRRRNALKSALALEGVLLTGLLILWIVYRPWPGPDTPTVLFASLLGLSAMGVQSALVRLLVRDSPSTNVMTTNITQFAIDTTEFVLAWSPRRDVPANATDGDHAEIKKRLTQLWPVILSFFFGTLAGAAAYVWLDLWCVALAIAIIGLLLVWRQR
jgi:uncharacterized membrane protein YoaK (UPF0700 family)